MFWILDTDSVGTVIFSYITEFKDLYGDMVLEVFDDREGRMSYLQLSKLEHLIVQDEDKYNKFRGSVCVTTFYNNGSLTMDFSVGGFFDTDVLCTKYTIVAEWKESDIIWVEGCFVLVDDDERTSEVIRMWHMVFCRDSATGKPLGVFHKPAKGMDFPFKVTVCDERLKQWAAKQIMLYWVCKPLRADIEQKMYYWWSGLLMP